MRGGDGVISVTANVAPRAMHDMCTLAKNGDAVKSTAIDNTLEGLHKNLFIESNPIPVKWALHRMGLIQDGIRLPLTWFSAKGHDPLLHAMQQAKLI